MSNQLFLYIALIFLTFSTQGIHVCYAQDLDASSSFEELESVVIAKVKQVSQFMGRFNYQQDLKGNKIKIKDNSRERKRYIASLFSEEIRQKTPKKELIEFIDEVVEQDQQILFENPNWFAQVNVTANYEGQEIPLLITMKPQYNVDSSVEWKILNIYSNTFSLPRQTFEDHIDGNAHESQFLRLTEQLNSQDKNAAFLPTNYHPDYLPLFLFLINQGSLQIQNVISLSFSFLQIPGWIFTIEYFNRLKHNSGWLISSISKADLHEKNVYLLTHLHLTKSYMLEGGKIPAYISYYPKKHQEIISYYKENKVLKTEHKVAISELISSFIDQFQSYLKDNSLKREREINSYFLSPYTRVNNFFHSAPCETIVEIKHIFEYIGKGAIQISQFSISFDANQNPDFLYMHGRNYASYFVEIQSQNNQGNVFHFVGNLFIDLSEIRIAGIN